MRKLNKERIEKVRGHIAKGSTNKQACSLVGIDETTFYRWVAKGKTATSGLYRQFVDALRSAEAESEAVHLANITHHSATDIGEPVHSCSNASSPMIGAAAWCSTAGC